MTEPADPAAPPDVPLFDVVVSMPSGARLDDIEKRAHAAGIASDRVERLVQALRGSPQAKIGSGVSRERADKAKAQFSMAGLHVDITPLLSIQSMVTGSFDLSYRCPACEKKVVLPDNRQCPACGIFVDKVTEEFLLKRKILEQERYRIESQAAKSAKDSDKRAREIMEASLRAKIREELENEYGLTEKKGFLGKISGPVRAVALLGLVGIAFIGGRGMSPEGMPWSKSANAKEAAGPKAMTADTLAKTSTAGLAAGAGAGAGAAGAPGTTGDPDIDDDPLMQAIGGARVGGKGISIEQALGAAQVLAKSVGNNTVERVMAGGNVGGGGGGGGAAAGAKGGAAGGSGGGPGAGPAGGAAAGSAGASAGAAGAGGAGPAGTAAATGGPGGAAGGAGQLAGAAPAVDVPKPTKAVLTAEFGNALSEMGQVSRAREALKAALASIDPVANAAAAAAVRRSDLQSQAWALQRLDAIRGRDGAIDLKDKILAIADPAERAQLLGSVAVILSRNPQMPAEISRAFLSLASDSVKAVTGPGQPNAALGDLAVSMAEVFASEIGARVKAGAWAKAKTTAVQVEELVKQAPDAWSQVRLHAVDHQVQQLLGNSDKAVQSLDAALALAGKNPNPLERAVWLRAIAQLADAASREQLQTMATSLQSQLEPKSGPEKAQALTHIAVLYAAGGLPVKSEQFRQLARSTAGLSPADSAVIHTELIIRSDLAMAKMLQGLGRYADAEAVLQRVGSYLF